jgi:hypothetical protein
MGKFSTHRVHTWGGNLPGVTTLARSGITMLLAFILGLKSLIFGQPVGTGVTKGGAISLTSVWSDMHEVAGSPGCCPGTDGSFYGHKIRSSCFAEVVGATHRTQNWVDRVDSTLTVCVNREGDIDRDRSEGFVNGSHLRDIVVLGIDGPTETRRTPKKVGFYAVHHKDKGRRREPILVGGAVRADGRSDKGIGFSL